MLAYLYLSMLGKPVNYLIHFYMRNQVYFNSIIVSYGVILAIAYYNFKKIEIFILEEMIKKYSINDIRGINLEKYNLDWEKILSKSRFPFITTSLFFTIYRVNKQNVIKVLKSKYLKGL